ERGEGWGGGGGGGERGGDGGGGGGRGGQQVGGQLGHPNPKEEPRGHEPGQQKFDRGLAPRLPHRRRRQRRQRRTRPEGHPEQNEVIARWRTMGLLAGEYLAEQISPDRFGKEGVTGPSHDRKEPGNDQNREPDDAGEALERQQPAGGAIDNDQRDGGKPDHHHDQRSLQQHAGGERRPEYGRGRPSAGSARSLASLPEIGARHRAHGDN